MEEALSIVWTRLLGFELIFEGILVFRNTKQCFLLYKIQKICQEFFWVKERDLSSCFKNHLHFILINEIGGIGRIGGIGLEFSNRPFIPLESPAIYDGDSPDRISIPYRKGGVKAPTR
jgi:hypothetical protein